MVGCPCYSNSFLVFALLDICRILLPFHYSTKSPVLFHFLNFSHHYFALCFIIFKVFKAPASFVPVYLFSSGLLSVPMASWSCLHIPQLFSVGYMGTSCSTITSPLSEYVGCAVTIPVPLYAFSAVGTFLRYIFVPALIFRIFPPCTYLVHNNLVLVIASPVTPSIPFFPRSTFCSAPSAAVSLPSFLQF